jgi:DNA recombination protein RmuC
VFLPAGNAMIIDSKASKFFTQLAQDVDNKELAGKLKTSMRQHLKELATKDYKEAVRSSLGNNNNTKEIKNISSIMFLPSEMALEKLQYIDNEFMQKAWELNIFPAGPISIINILSHAKFMIDSEKQLNNHNIIVQEVRKLLQSLNVVFEHIKKVGSHIQAAANNYDKLAGSFNSNILPKVRNMQKLGINLPQNKSFTTSLDRYQMVFSHDVIIEDVKEEDSQLILEKTL